MIKKDLVKKYSKPATAVLTAAAMVMGACGGYAASASASETKETKTPADNGEKSDEKAQVEQIVSENANHVSGEKEEDIEDVDKEETVYIMADASGKETEVIVSDWLKNKDGKQKLSDTSDLTDIENVKGDETFTRSGSALTWDAGGNDIYYQGKPTKEAPVKVAITYYLDGKKVDADALDGASGHVKLHVEYKNSAKSGNVSIPFAMVTGTILPTDQFKNVEVTNGKLMSDGDKLIVVGYGLPGLAESLRLDKVEDLKDIEIPEGFDIEADAEDFSLMMTMTVAMPLDLSDMTDEDGEFDPDEMKDSLDELADASEQLVDGTEELADGADTLKASFGTLLDGINTLDDGAASLTTGLDTLYTSSFSLVDGVESLDDGIQTLNANKGALVDGVNALAAGSQSLADGSASLAEGVDAYTAGADALSSGAAAYVDGVSSLLSGMNSYVSGASQLAQGVQVLNENVRTMAGSLQNSSTAELAESMTQVDAYIQNLESAIAQDSAVVELLQGVQSGLCEVEVSEEEGALLQGYADTLGTAIGYVQADIEMEQGALAAWNTFRDQASAALSSESESDLTSAVAQLAEATAQLAEGADTLLANEEALTQGSAAIAQAGDSLAEGAASLSGQSSALKSGAASVNAGAGEVADGANTLADSAGVLGSGIGALSDGSTQLRAGSAALGSGIAQLCDGGSRLKDGAAQLSDGGQQMDDGIKELADGAHELHDGMTEFDEEGIKELTSILDDDIMDLSDRLKDVQDAGKAYKLFTKSSADMTGKVKFIIETEGIGE